MAGALSAMESLMGVESRWKVAVQLSSDGSEAKSGFPKFYFYS